jgi:redox-regulated HSP33 family molecular chaperone
VRHVYAYRVTYLIAALIVAAAVLFAWLRSQEREVVPQSGGQESVREVLAHRLPPGSSSYAPLPCAGPQGAPLFVHF